METEQLIFAIVLGLVTLLISGFGAYVVWSMTWSDRWYPRHDDGGPE